MYYQDIEWDLVTRALWKWPQFSAKPSNPLNTPYNDSILQSVQRIQPVEKLHMYKDVSLLTYKTLEKSS